jgi:hypothetical protein
MNNQTCPHCHQELTEEQLKRLWAQYCGSRRSAVKANAAIENGAKGGRPMTYFQTVYESIPEGVSLVHEKLRRWNEKHIFDVHTLPSNNPSSEGFDLKCDNIVWHCEYNPLTDYIEVTANGRKQTAIWRINYSAKVAAKKLVEDIHRSKLMSMPDDYSDQIEWIEKQTGKPFDIKQILPDL